jgi:hypothetical protein
MSNILIVPAEIVWYVRSGVHIVLNEVADDIAEAAIGYERQAHPEWFMGLFERFDAIRALLDVVGWSVSGVKDLQGVEVDIDAHREELVRALKAQLAVEEDIRRDLDRRNSTKTDRDLAVERERELREFVDRAMPRLAEG